MNSRVPIRWRITLWYAALLSATLLLFGVGLYVGLRELLYDNFQEQVRQQASLVVAGLDLTNGVPFVDQATIRDFQDDERFLRVLTADGSIVADTSAFAQIPADALAIAGFPPSTTNLTVINAGSEHFGVVSIPIVESGTTIGVVQVGIARGDIDEALRAVSLVLAIAAPLALLVAIAGGYLLSRRTLSPVVAITDMAEALQANELGTRLHLKLPNDELGRLARTFNAMLDRIEFAFERQRRFTGDAAHELRTPLSLLRSQVDLALKRDRTGEEYRAALQDIGVDLERLTTLVSTLLTLARADTGQLRIERAWTDLATVISPLLEAYAPLAAESGITLVNDASSTGVVADEDLIIQVLVNLVDNAIAHTPPGGRITVGCGEHGSSSCFWVSDTGVGIAPEHLPRVFERFYRVDTGRTRAAGGTGLGLAFCKAIADAHGGTIEVTSQPGNGSRFEFCSPVTPS